MCKRSSRIIAAAAADHLSILPRERPIHIYLGGRALDAPPEVMGRSRPVLQTFIRHALFSTRPRAPPSRLIRQIHTPPMYVVRRKLKPLVRLTGTINAAFRAKSAMGNCLFRSREQQFRLPSCVKIIRRHCQKRGGNWGVITEHANVGYETLDSEKSSFFCSGINSNWNSLIVNAIYCDLQNCSWYGLATPCN
jgi:hypothetical protein